MQRGVIKMVEILTNLKTGQTTYFGNIMGFSYCMDFDTEEEFKIWLKGRLKEIYFTEPTGSILKELFGIKSLEERILTLEKEIKKE